MAKLRSIKKEIDYLVAAVISDCATCMFIGGKSQEKIVEIMEDAIEARNSFIDSANHPAEKNNVRLVRKHYAQLRSDLIAKADELFTRLSKACMEL